MSGYDDGFIPHFDLESELYTAMAEETDGLGAPELDMERVHGAGRRRRMVLAGSGAAAVMVGVTVVAVAVGGSGGSGKSGAVAAAGSRTTSAGPATPTATQTSTPAPGQATLSKGAPPVWTPSGTFTLSPRPDGCDAILLVIPPVHSGTSMPEPPSSLPTPVNPHPAGNQDNRKCQPIVELSPYRKVVVPPNITGSFPGGPLLPTAPSDSSEPSPPPSR